MTSARTGRAFIVSGMTAIVGVAVLSASSLPLLRDFGIIVSMNVLVALLSALVVLPPMLVWADGRNMVSRGLIPDEHLVESPMRKVAVGRRRAVGHSRRLIGPSRSARR